MRCATPSTRANPRQVVYDVKTMEGVIANSLANTRLYLWLIAWFRRPRPAARRLRRVRRDFICSGSSHAGVRNSPRAGRRSVPDPALRIAPWRLAGSVRRHHRRRGNPGGGAPAAEPAQRRECRRPRDAGHRRRTAGRGSARRLPRTRPPSHASGSPGRAEICESGSNPPTVSPRGEQLAATAPAPARNRPADRASPRSPPRPAPARR